jgi:peptidoglycan/LPS O-acetylase OafA/YrhL
MSTCVDQPARYDHLQMMRGVACSMVFLNHAAGYLSISLSVPETSWFAPLLVPYGFPWVWLFLVLSGFLLTKVFVSGRFELNFPGIRTFYGKRARRLLPLIWSVLVLWATLYYFQIWSSQLPTFDLMRELGIAAVLPWVPYFPSTQAIGSVNSPIWSAVVEVHYCILMPLLLLAVRMSLVRILAVLLVWAVAMLVLAASVLVLGKPAIFPMIYGAHFYNAGFFIAGMALALGFGSGYAKKVPWSVVVALACLSLVGTQYAAHYALESALAVLPFILLPVWCLLVARADDKYQSDLPATLSQVWGGTDLRRWIELVGMMSYSVYVVHKPLCYILIDRLNLGAFVTGYSSFYLMTAVCFLMLLPIFALIHIGVEARFRRQPLRSSPFPGV